MSNPADLFHKELIYSSSFSALIPRACLESFISTSSSPYKLSSLVKLTNIFQLQRERSAGLCSYDAWHPSMRSQVGVYAGSY